MYYVQTLLWQSLADEAHALSPLATTNSTDSPKTTTTQSNTKSTSAVAAASASTATTSVSTATTGATTEKELIKPKEKDGNNLQEKDSLPDSEAAAKASLWQQLKQVDPLMANRLHPNETRKVGACSHQRVTASAAVSIISTHYTCRNKRIPFEP